MAGPPCSSWRKRHRAGVRPLAPEAEMLSPQMPWGAPLWLTPVRCLSLPRPVQCLVGKMKDYVTAAVVAGASQGRILFRHILPNVIGPLLVQVSVDIPRAVELEASLSFLGLGVAVTTPSIELHVSQAYQYLYSGASWASVLPVQPWSGLVGEPDWRLDPRCARSSHANYPQGTKCTHSRGRA